MGKITALEVARVVKKLTFKQCAELCHVSVSTYRRWEKNNRWPKGTLQKLDPEYETEECVKECEY